MDEHNDSLVNVNTLSHSGPQEDPLIDQVFDGRYLVIRKLGEGGFGAVYLASDERMTSRKVVVKILLKEESTNEESVKRFQQEIEALARVDHPAIVGVYDFGKTADGTPYIVMQYVEGVNLRTLIEQGNIDLQRIANTFRQAGRALTAAHSKGILHRDLKPENIMLQKLGDGDEQVKIIDFGVAEVKDSNTLISTGADHAVGTIAYMSPEQLSVEPLTPACDIYSMAVIAYEMITGRRPLNPSSAYKLLDLQSKGVRTRPSELHPNLPPLVDQVVLKALAFEPDHRYASAREFGDSLADALTGVSEETLDVRRSSLPTVKMFVEKEAPVTATVLFMDIVGYSKLLMDEQTSQLRRLQEMVQNSSECRTAYDNKQCIRLPTGDGFALVFFAEPETAVRSALQITEMLKGHPEIALRMGIHSGLVYRMADINTNLNVAGGGINLAQRVMDCGDTGHILLSKRVADDLSQLSNWVDYLHDLGEAEVKHGVRIHIFNLYGDGFGNSALPAKLAKTKPKFNYGVAGAIAALLLVGLLVVAWYLSRSRTTPPTRPTETVAAAGTEPRQTLTYWLTVQAKSGNSFGKDFQSSGNEVYNTGSRFKFNIQPEQQGALYLLSEGPGEKGETVYDILFPTPRQGGKANLQAKEVWQSSWNVFVESTGVEKLWIVWSGQPLSELDALFSDASKTAGRISGAGVEQLKKYLAEYQTNPPKVVPMKEKDITVVSGSGNLIVSRIELSHKEY